ncbi:DUF2730 family protein [Azospirillum argentinense]|uniref:DUF2730 family protein n=1 Tax=Azospirillum argentinense TaxID=2970906 RepID=A0ABW8VEA2_9PROT
MDITLGQVQFAFTIGSAMAALIATGIMWRLKGEFASKSDIRTLFDRLDKVEREQAGLAIRVEQVPTHEDIHAVSTKLAEVAGDVKALEATIATGMQGVRDQLSMLVKHHLEKA